MTVDELIASPEIDVVLNLTPPTVHAAVVGGALEAGKHVYTEKPLTTSVADAQELVAVGRATRPADRLRTGHVPRSAYEAAPRADQRGDIGEPLGATATMLVGGPDNWHPNADIFYRAGGGPMLDLAPYYLTAIASLLGPFASATGFADDADAGAHARRRAAQGRDVHRRRRRRTSRRRSGSSGRARDAHRELRVARTVRQRHGRARERRARSSSPTRTSSTAT